METEIFGLPDIVDELVRVDVADVVPTKADDAQAREFKTPGNREPQLPAVTDTVLPILSVHAVGKFVDAVEDDLGEEVYQTDVLEAAMEVAIENPGLVAEKCRKYGYDWE